MFELLEKAFLTGLGAISLSQKKAEEFMADVKDRYKLSEDEGKAFLERMQGIAKEGKQRIEEMADIEVKRAIDRLGLVSREEFDRLQRRVAILESRSNEPEPGEPC